MNGLKVMVTGGSGFIGSAVVERLHADGFAVANVDVKPPIHARHDRFWLRGDIVERARLSACFDEAGPDAIVHLAAKADIVATEWADFASIHEGTANLLTCAEGHAQVKRIVNVSTQLVIGPGEEPASLLDFRPYTMYGEAKAHAEELLLKWPASTHWLTVRPTNIWGPHHPSFAHAIWKYIDRRVYLHPSGAPVYRTYGYVDNMADQIIASLKADPAKTARQIYYGGDAVLDSAMWVDAFAMALTGRRARRLPTPLLRMLGRAGDLISAIGIRSPIDSGRVMRMTQNYAQPLAPMIELAGPPRMSLADGVAESVAWLRRQPGFDRDDKAADEAAGR